MPPLRDALGFLTVLPLKAGPPTRGAVVLFPAAGLVIGLAWTGAAWLGLHIGGPLVAAGLVLLIDFALTGALHLDGLADTADGLASHRPPEEAREVMKDPRVGAVGAAALGTVLLLRFALVGAVAAVGQGWWMIALAPVIGRFALVWQLHRSAPRERSVAKGPAAAATLPVTVAAALVTVAVVAAAGALSGFGWPAGLALTAGTAAAHLAYQRWRRRLGTGGDTIGASGIVAETVALASLALGVS
ncbi:adenosylcobinamide-GDP ribazoletransferase [Glycomyces sp. TRM65418]|uniref:adenosylcobinamide-GDP ribazoletransferase n=1 Tax=Glycomyces sp. TRM65418 TaxID=2867006 RepID=UPI001CE6DF21|nr:adenosylcobinamide-GDP ribazoletransferase [Glycomyces sp. TRM65418]MCC3764537.1 adenosylcobinamide-GDP ribazoletransferase [Glycomyces sp. TRM65418]QZD54204.1 adenosylcobinamide-GDP ribazoletransferase [Glycomyces sp. TRM65418]